MDIPSIFVFMNDCGADSDNKQVMGIKTISLYDFITLNILQIHQKCREFFHQKSTSNSTV